MKVYIVISADTDLVSITEEILGVFSTEQLATVFIETLPTVPHYYYSIKEYTLDEKDN